MEPEDYYKAIKALDELVETALRETVTNRKFDGQNLLDFVGKDIGDYWDTLPRTDGLLVYGPYDLEDLVGVGRRDLSLVIDVITDEANEEIVSGFRISLMDESTQSVGGPNRFRPEIDEIFHLDLGEFSTLEEMENLFNKTMDFGDGTAKVSLVGDALDEIFPNSPASIEMALTNKGPVISDRLRRDIGREWLPEYAKEAFEKVDAEQAAQYGELAGDVEVPDTVEGDVDKLDFDGPDITLNPDGSTTEKTPSGSINENVPIEDFKGMVGGNPFDTKLPQILDVLKGSDEYRTTQFILHSMDLEYKDRQKFHSIIKQQYDIYFDLAKDLSTEDKKILLKKLNDRVYELDEKYKKITVKNDVDLSLQELTTFDNVLENDAKNLKKELTGMLDDIKLTDLDFESSLDTPTNVEDEVIEEKRPRGRPKSNPPKWAWVITEEGVVPVEVRKHQGVYKTFNYDKETGKTTFYKEVKTPVFDSLEEANKNVPEFTGYKEDVRGLQGKGREQFYDSKYGYELSPDNKLSVVEYRYNPASGTRTKEGYRRYSYDEFGNSTKGGLAPGELFDSPEAAIDNYKAIDTPTNVVDDKLKRINEILEQGIKATGIDADPDAPNYFTDNPTEHGDLIRELENNGTLKELQDLVGGSEELDNFILDIVNEQIEVSPRYLESKPPLNQYGEEFGAKGAYGITTEELKQKEIQDVIKQTLGIDTPTNVVEGTVTEMEEYRFKKLIEEVDDATPDVTKITPEQARTIDDAIEESMALLSRERFELIQGSKNRPFKNIDITYDQAFKAIKNKLVNIFADGVTLVDAYELGLIIMSITGAVDTSVEGIIDIVFPNDTKDNRSFPEKVIANLDDLAPYSPTEQFLRKNKESRAMKLNPEVAETARDSYNRGDITFFEHMAALDKVIKGQKSYVYEELTPNIGMIPTKMIDHANPQHVFYNIGETIKGNK